MHVGRATEKVWENEQLHVDTMKQRIATQTYPPVAMDSLGLSNIKLSIQNRSGFAAWLAFGGGKFSRLPYITGLQTTQTVGLYAPVADAAQAQ